MGVQFCCVQRSCAARWVIDLKCLCGCQVVHLDKRCTRKHQLIDQGTVPTLTLVLTAAFRAHGRCVCSARCISLWLGKQHSLKIHPRIHLKACILCLQTGRYHIIREGKSPLPSGHVPASSELTQTSQLRKAVPHLTHMGASLYSSLLQAARQSAIGTASHMHCRPA